MPKYLIKDEIDLPVTIHDHRNVHVCVKQLTQLAHSVGHHVVAISCIVLNSEVEHGRSNISIERVISLALGFPKHIRSFLGVLVEVKPLVAVADSLMTVIHV